MRSTSLFLNLIGATALALMAACGGGGGGNAAGKASSLSYEDCMRLPEAGLVNTYSGTYTSRNKWRSATFLGEEVMGQYFYDDYPKLDTLSRAEYFKTDAASGTVTALGYEEFDPNTGAVVKRVKYTQLVLPLHLDIGQSVELNTAQKDLLPEGTPSDEYQEYRHTIRYDGNQTINLAAGRIETCVVTRTFRWQVGEPQVWREESGVEHYAPGLGVVKSYLHNSDGVNLLDELVSTSANVSFEAPTASTAPSLASCTAIPVGLTGKLTDADDLGSNSPDFHDYPLEANPRGGTQIETTLGSFNQSTSIALKSIDLGNPEHSPEFRPAPRVKGVRYYEPAFGFLREVGRELEGASWSLTGKPDLRQAVVGQTVPYKITATRLGGSDFYRVGATETSFTFVGHEKITTPAGTFDTCKVRYTYDTGATATFFYAPNSHWVRAESISPKGVRHVSELIP